MSFDQKMVPKKVAENLFEKHKLALILLIFRHQGLICKGGRFTLPMAHSISEVLKV